MILTRNGRTFTFRATKALLARFAEARIYSSEEKSQEAAPRWKVGDVLEAPTACALEPYVTFRVGNRIYAFGAGSYTGSVLCSDLKVGRYCSIAGQVAFSGWEHPHRAVTTSLVACDQRVKWAIDMMADQGVTAFTPIPTPQKGPSVIGNDVWIGTGAKINRGVTIGDGAVVAGGSHVTRDVAPYTIVGGNKAEVIRYRFPEEIRAALQELQWWRYRFADLADLDFASPPAFINGLAKRVASLEPWTPPLFHVYDEVAALAKTS